MRDHVRFNTKQTLGLRNANVSQGKLTKTIKTEPSLQGPGEQFTQKGSDARVGRRRPVLRGVPQGVDLPGGRTERLPAPWGCVSTRRG